jgi:predicted tellurium resistance membrane protein TerC
VNVPLWAWMAFVAFILVMLAVDLAAHRRAHVVSVREAAAWSAVWVALGLGFAGVLWVWQGAAAAGQYLAGFLIEKSLAVDNIFVFALLSATSPSPANTGTGCCSTGWWARWCSAPSSSPPGPRCWRPFM